VAVGGEDAGEEAEVGGDAGGSVGIGGGGEVDGAADRALLFQVLEELPVVGEMDDVELDGVGKVAFKGGFALKQPARDVEERGRTVAGYGEGGVVKGVRLDEGPVEIDTKHWVDTGQWLGGEVECGGRDGQKCPSLRLNR
jgi:hypothetical protein